MRLALLRTPVAPLSGCSLTGARWRIVSSHSAFRSSGRQTPFLPPRASRRTVPRQAVFRSPRQRRIQSEFSAGDVKVKSERVAAGDVDAVGELAGRELALGGRGCYFL